MVMRSAPRPLRRRLRHAVVDGAEILIDLDRLQSGRIGILQILNDPKTAAIVEGHRYRLANRRLAGDELDLETVGDLHAFDRLFGGVALSA